MPTPSRLLLLTLLCTATSYATELPQLQLQGPLTVSGLSSGGYMAGQFHIAYSDLVSGAAIIAAGPYGCAQNSLITALAHCFNKDSSTPDLAAINKNLKAAEIAKLIAPLSNLVGDKVFLLHGVKDQTVHQKVSDALTSQYRQFGAQVLYVNDQPFAHHFPTLQTGTACDVSEPPFIGACQYDAAGALLRQLYPSLQANTALANHKPASGQLLTLDQQQLGGEAAAGLGPEAYLFVPNSCNKTTACQLHISFHGCKQYAELVGDAYAKGSGINQWAAANKLVVLYPQTKASALDPMNPNGCWDWWGYTGADYASRQGVQLKAVLQMIKTLGYPVQG